MLEEGPRTPIHESATRIEREVFLRAFSVVTPPPEVASRIVQVLTDVRAKAGTVLFRRGDETRNALFIVAGQVDLIDEEGDEISFDPGSIIGILDLNIGRPRQRTAVARTDVHLLEMPYDAWVEILEDNPEYSARARRVVAGGLHDILLTLAPDAGFGEPARREPFATDPVSRIMALRSSRTFGRARVQTLADLSARGQLVRADAGELVAPPGRELDRVFLILKGGVEVERRLSPVVRARFGVGELVLGPSAFSGALGRYAVTALEPDTTLLALEHNDIDDVADDHYDLVKSIMRQISIERDRLQGLRAKRERASRRPSQIPPRSK